MWKVDFSGIQLKFQLTYWIHRDWRTPSRTFIHNILLEKAIVKLNNDTKIAYSLFNMESNTSEDSREDDTELDMQMSMFCLIVLKNLESHHFMKINMSHLIKKLYSILCRKRWYNKLVRKIWKRSINPIYIV